MKRRIEISLLHDTKSVTVEIKPGQTVHVAHHLNPDKLFVSIDGKEYYSDGSIFINDIL